MSRHELARVGGGFAWLLLVLGTCTMPAGAGIAGHDAGGRGERADEMLREADPRLARTSLR